MGDPPTNQPGLAPPFGELRDPEPTVIASGLTAEGDAFEFVLYGTDQGPCLGLMLPPQPLEAGAACGSGILDFPGGPLSVTGRGTFGRGEAYVEGLVSREVASVEVEYDTDDQAGRVDAVVEQIPDDLVRAAGATPPVRFFAAFPPGARTGSDVTVIAHSHEGEELASHTVSVAGGAGDPAPASAIDLDVEPKHEPGRRVAADVGCLACHLFGESGNPGPGPDLTHIGNEMTGRQIARAVRRGPGVMPSYEQLARRDPKRFEELVSFLASLD